MATKVFDIVIKSKYTPEGVRGFLGGLSDIGQAGFNIRQGLIGPLQEAGQKIFDLISVANPERVERLSNAFTKIEVALGKLLDEGLGPAIDDLSELIEKATLLSDAESNLAPIYEEQIEKLKARGLSMREVVAEIRAASDATVEAAEREKEANPFFFMGVNAEDFGIKQERLTQLVMEGSGTLTEYINNLDLAGVKYASLTDEIDRFNEAHGKVAPSFRDVIAAQQDFISGVAAIGEERIQIEEQIGVRLGDMLIDQAIRRGDALEDQARRNARTLAQISEQRINAIQQASESLTSELADIDDESSRERIRIEERFQERIKQIKNQFGDQIEEAIRRRDARGLAGALKGQKDQLNQATRDRDTQARDRAEDTSDQQRDAQERQKEEEARAEEAAERAQEQLATQTKIANEERERGFKRQQRNQGISFDRLRRDRNVEDAKEITALKRQNQKKLREIDNYFDGIERIIDSRLAVGGRLLDLINTAVVDTLGGIFGAP